MARGNLISDAADDTAATGRAHRIGLRGERVVAGVARARGWRVAQQRLRTPAGEADIFALRAIASPALSAAQARAGVVIEVKAAWRRWPSVDLVGRRRQARLWRVAALLSHQHQLAEVGVVVALVYLNFDHEEVRWIELEAW